jgi:hypothetical protein
LALEQNGYYHLIIFNDHAKWEFAERLEFEILQERPIPTFLEERSVHRSTGTTEMVNQHIESKLPEAIPDYNSIMSKSESTLVSVKEPLKVENEAPTHGDGAFTPVSRKPVVEHPSTASISSEDFNVCNMFVSKLNKDWEALKKSYRKKLELVCMKLPVELTESIMSMYNKWFEPHRLLFGVFWMIQKSFGNEVLRDVVQWFQESARDQWRFCSSMFKEIRRFNPAQRNYFSRLVNSERRNLIGFPDFSTASNIFVISEVSEYLTSLVRCDYAAVSALESFYTHTEYWSRIFDFQEEISSPNLQTNDSRKNYSELHILLLNLSLINEMGEISIFYSLKLTKFSIKISWKSKGEN